VAEALSHARHDRFAIAAAIGGGDAPSTVVTCPHCGALHRDLLALQTALRHAWTPKRPRDLHLDAFDLASPRPALWRRLLGVIGSSRDAITRPLAIGLTSVGIVGVVLTSTASGLGGMASGAAPGEVAIKAAGGPTAPPGDAHVTQEQAAADPVLAMSTGALAAGGGVFVLRRVAARVRGVR
jgi:hypothetical protein